MIRTAYSCQTALDALDAIAQQGEASDTATQADEVSHFERFMQLYEEVPGDGAGWSAARPVARNPRALGGDAGVPDTTYLANKISRTWASLLNLRYRMLLTYLAHTFRISGDAGPEHGQARAAVLNRVFGEMYNLRAIANILVTLPAGEPADALRSGPSFELPYTLALPYFERDTWRVHLDLLDGASTLINDLVGTTGTEADAYLAALLTMDADAKLMVSAVLDGSLRTSKPQRAGASA